MENNNSTDSSTESYSQQLSIEEHSIEEILSRIENSDNPTLDLSILLENSQQLGSKIQSKVESGSKKQLAGKYSLTDRLNNFPIIKDKILNSKLEDDKKLVLLYVYGDKESSKTMTDYYKSQSPELDKSNPGPSFNNDSSLTL